MTSARSNAAGSNGPPHRCLEHAVELVEPNARWDQEPTPDAGLDLAQLDRAVDDGLARRRGHALDHTRTGRRPAINATHEQSAMPW